MRFRSLTSLSVAQFVDEEEQQENYSGKKKKHTVKNAVIITACCLILFVSRSVCGKMHDKKIADTLYSFSQPCLLYQDSGYQGFRPEGVIIKQPIKKPRRRSLTPQEKEYNRQVASFGIRREHAIGSVKHLRILKEECRLRAGNFVKRIFKTGAALRNFRIKIDPWRYEI